MEQIDKIYIRPGVGILQLLKNQNYKPWFALAEFIDNAIDSFLKFETQLKQVEGEAYKLKVVVEVNTNDNKITIRDNAAGIHSENYLRAFRAAEAPYDRSGLSEFGIGMKQAACWFCDNWIVRTSALGENIERIVEFDLQSIVADSIEELNVEEKETTTNSHFTIIELYNIHNKLPKGRGLGKVKEHLASIYRDFIRRGILDLYWGDEKLVFKEIKILKAAPAYKNASTEQVIEWKKTIDFPIDANLSVKGFVAIRETGSVTESGIALFRRGRVVEGSFDEPFKPEFIFGKPNSFRSQRVFGELHLEGFGVAHTKDGFQWDDNMELFLQMLRDDLKSEPSILRQAEDYRERPTNEQYKKTSENVLATTTNSIQDSIAAPLDTLRETPLKENEVTELQITTEFSSRELEIFLNGVTWIVSIELSYDDLINDWLEVFDDYLTNNAQKKSNKRYIRIRLALKHPFMIQFAGTNKLVIEPLLRVAAALALSEVVVIESGANYAQRIRNNINKLLREALSK